MLLTFRKISVYLSHIRQLKETISIFQGNPLFQGFAAEEIASLLASAPDPTRFARGEQLLSPGSTKRALGFLLEGSALVTRGGAGVAMSRLTPGAAFGMATLFASGEPFPNEIRAETACTALFLPQQWVAEMIGREARFAFNYIALLSERILFLNRRIDTFTAGDVPQRLRGMLDQFRRRQGGGAALTLPCSYTQLASLLGVGRASLYRALEQLEGEGLFTREGRVFHFAEDAFQIDEKSQEGL